MKSVIKMKIVVDIAMTILIILLMSYGLIGEENHEWLGMGMFILFVLHHGLNYKWHMNIKSGRYAVIRILQTAVVAVIFLCMIGSMVSGIMLSRYLFSSLPLHNENGTVEEIHILCAYWGFVMMSLHLGFHWNMITSMFQKHRKVANFTEKVLKLLVCIIVIYGVFAFIQRDIADYLFLRSHFVFFDYAQPKWHFFIDYVSVMGLFVMVGFLILKFVKKIIE